MDQTDAHPEPVAVATYAHLGEAEVSKAHLASEGIEAFILDESEGGVVPVEGDLGVVVAVHADDAEVARQVLTPVIEA